VPESTITNNLINLATNGLTIYNYVLTATTPTNFANLYAADIHGSNFYGNISGTNLTAGTVNSNKLDTDTLALITTGAGAGITNNQYLPGTPVADGQSFTNLAATNITGTFSAIVSTSITGGGSGITNLSDTQRIFVVSTSGDDSTGRRGEYSKPYRSVWSWDGTNHTGAATAATNGDTIIVLPGNYSAANIVLADGVSLIGVGMPSICRTSALVYGTNAPSNLSVNGSLINPGDNCVISGLRLFGVTNVSGGGGVIGNYRNAEFPTYGTTNSAFTNVVVSNCVLGGDVDVIYLEGYSNVCSVHVASCTITSSWDVFVANTNATIYSIGNDICAIGSGGSAGMWRGSGNLYDIGSRATVTASSGYALWNSPGAYLSMNGTEVNVTGGATELNTTYGTLVGNYKSVATGKMKYIDSTTSDFSGSIGADAFHFLSVSGTTNSTIEWTNSAPSMVVVVSAGTNVVNLTYTFHQTNTGNNMSQWTNGNYSVYVNNPTNGDYLWIITGPGFDASAPLYGNYEPGIGEVWEAAGGPAPAPTVFFKTNAVDEVRVSGQLLSGRAIMKNNTDTPLVEQLPDSGGALWVSNGTLYFTMLTNAVLTTTKIAP